MTNTPKNTDSAPNTSPVNLFSGIASHYVGMVCEIPIRAIVGNIPYLRPFVHPISKIGHEIVENLLNSGIIYNIQEHDYNFLKATTNSIFTIFECPKELIFTSLFSYGFEISYEKILKLEHNHDIINIHNVGQGVASSVGAIIGYYTYKNLLTTDDQVTLTGTDSADLFE